jgi:hypothetical protein
VTIAIAVDAKNEFRDWPRATQKILAEGVVCHFYT